MKDHPSIFSGPMVRALLDGRKTQTRRLATSPLAKVRVGDRLWVRETWARTTNVNDQDPWPNRPCCVVQAGEVVIYGADGHWDWCDGDGFSTDRSMWKPSIHMPRWASRLTLRVTEVRRQWLQEISEADAEAEGVVMTGKVYAEEADDFGGTYRALFAELWDGLHPLGEGWANNPEVVAITFEVQRGNIDATTQPHDALSRMGGEGDGV